MELDVRKAPAMSGGLPLGTIAIPGTNPPIFRVSGGAPTAINKNVPLFINGSDSGATSDIINLFIQGGNPSSAISVPLFVRNDYRGANRRVTLFIEGTGVNPGYVPIDSNINLFIARGPNAGITLFVCNTDTFKSVPLFISGSIGIGTRQPDLFNPGAVFGSNPFQTHLYGPNCNYNLSPPLFIRGAGDNVEETVTLFISGIAPTQINSNVTLVIPSVNGVTAKNLTLYIHGFKY